MNEFNKIEIIPILIRDDIKKGDNIADLIIKSIKDKNESLQENDVVIITHKIISKAEGRTTDLRNIVPSEESKKFLQILVRITTSGTYYFSINEIVKIERILL
jgi:coenzyme F420-0:L-glutamate ligase/coenzyme F420-1:gamma-L-glutamate ligase